jgi:hypothetical protein
MGVTPCGDPANTPAALRSRFCQRYFWLEKIGVEYADRNVEVTLGDFYAVFGRGLVLSLRKVDELGVDTTILGGKVVYHRENVGATLVAGVTNVQNNDEATGRATSDPFDLVAGARLEYRLLDRVTIGVHEAGGVWSRNFVSGEQRRRDGIFMYGLSVDAPRLLRWLSLYAEAAGQMTQQTDERKQGWAVYGAATAAAGPVTFLLEVKHYDAFERWRSSIPSTLAEFGPVAYNQPPTGERVVTELTSPSYDVTGPRLRIDWRVNDRLLLFASSAYFQDRGSVGGGHRTYHDPFGGFELRWQGGASHFFGSGGYRLELCASSPCKGLEPGPSDVYQSIGHVEWDLTQALPARLSLESQGQALIRQGDDQTILSDQGVLSSPRWTEGNAYVALKWTYRLAFIGGYEWTTRPSSTRVTDHFFNGTLQWNITTSSSLRLFVGGMRGGLRCISGVCRDFPSFTGARLEVVVRL